MLGIYVAGDSGAYLNPAITFSNCLYRQLPWRRFPAYFIAQLLGGMVGSCVVYANYISAIDFYEGGHGIRTVPPAPKATAGIFATYPQPFVTKASQFFSEFIASSILMFVIFALKDRANMGMAKVKRPRVHAVALVNAIIRAINGSPSCSSSSFLALAPALAGKRDMHSTLLVTSHRASCRMVSATVLRYGRPADTISG
jgi:glycerol uptake facilitator-like aquaporin